MEVKLENKQAIEQVYGKISLLAKEIVALDSSINKVDDLKHNLNKLKELQNKYSDLKKDIIHADISKDNKKDLLLNVENNLAKDLNRINNFIENEVSIIENDIKEANELIADINKSFHLLDKDEQKSGLETKNKLIQDIKEKVITPLESKIPQNNIPKVEQKQEIKKLTNVLDTPTYSRRFLTSIKQTFQIMKKNRNEILNKIKKKGKEVGREAFDLLDFLARKGKQKLDAKTTAKIAVAALVIVMLVFPPAAGAVLIGGILATGIAALGKKDNEEIGSYQEFKNNKNEKRLAKEQIKNELKQEQEQEQEQNFKDQTIEQKASNGDKIDIDKKSSNETKNIQNTYIENLTKEINNSELPVDKKEALLAQVNDLNESFVVEPGSKVIEEINSILEQDTVPVVPIEPEGNTNKSPKKRVEGDINKRRRKPVEGDKNKKGQSKLSQMTLTLNKMSENIKSKNKENKSNRQARKSEKSKKRRSPFI